MLTNGAECVVEVRPTRVDNYSHTYCIIFRIIFVLCASRYATGLKSLFAVLCNQPALLKVMRMFLYYLICVICHLYFVCIINHGIAGIKPAPFYMFYTSAGSNSRYGRHGVVPGA